MTETSLDSLDYFLGLEGEPFFNQPQSYSLPSLIANFLFMSLFLLYVKHHTKCPDWLPPMCTIVLGQRSPRNDLFAQFLKGMPGVAAK